jgi:hypothetical protein
MISLFDKLAAEESAFYASEFLSPVLKGCSVRVRISGIIVNFTVQPKKFEGWGIFRILKQKTAKFLREPTLAQKREYFNLYEKFSLIIVRQGDTLAGIAANSGDGRIRIQGQVPISLANETRLFDTVDVRWDGVNFWYDSHSNFRSPMMASTLRDLLVAEVAPSKLDVSGMTQEERTAYRIAYDSEVESKKDRKEERLRDAVVRAGGVFHGYVERGNTYTVEISVDGERYHPVVDTKTLQGVSAGICLSGGDAVFDLQSLVGVFREGQSRSLIHRW